MVRSNRLKLYLASEKLVVPYTLCRASADFACTMGASLNQLGLGANGRALSKMARRARLLRAKKAGGEDRSGYGQRHVRAMHQAMFPGSPNPIEVVTTKFGEDLWQHLGRNSDDKTQDGPRVGDHMISVSLDLGAVPASSSLRKHTGPVFHQVALWVRSVDNQNVYVLDGMADYTGGMNGYWAPKADVAKAAKAIAEGYVICELYPVGGWTDAKAPNAAQVNRINELIEKNVKLASKLAALEDSTSEQIDELQAELESCEAAGSLNRTEVLDEAIQALEQLK